MPKMTAQELLPIWRDSPAAFEAEAEHTKTQYRSTVEAMRDGIKLDADGKFRRPRGDREALPPDYAIESTSRGYYTLTAPDGTVVEEGLHGKENAADAAWRNYR